MLVCNDGHVMQLMVVYQSYRMGASGRNTTEERSVCGGVLGLRNFQA